MYRSYGNTAASSALWVANCQLLVGSFSIEVYKIVLGLMPKITSKVITNKLKALCTIYIKVYV